MDQVHLRTDLPETVLNYRQCYRINAHISALVVVQPNIYDEISDVIDVCCGPWIDDAGRIRLLDDSWSVYKGATADQCSVVDSRR